MVQQYENGILLTRIFVFYHNVHEIQILSEKTGKVGRELYQVSQGLAEIN